MSVAARVSQEMGVKLGNEVSMHFNFNVFKLGSRYTWHVYVHVYLKGMYMHCKVPLISHSLSAPSGEKQACVYM